MGISRLTPGDYVNYTTSFGGMTKGMTVEENTNAFATFANGGKFIDAYIVERIEDMDGNLIFEHKAEPVDVFSPETSYIVTDMLRDVLKPGGTGSHTKQNLNFNSISQPSRERHKVMGTLGLSATIRTSRSESG